MANFCVNCGALLAPDARFCTSCNAPTSIAAPVPAPAADAYSAGPVRGAAEAAKSSSAFIWAAALQIYWLLHGVWAMLLGGTVLAVGLGIMGVPSAMPPGFAAGNEPEKILVSIFLAFLAGAFDVCVSGVLIYGLLTHRTWAHGVFMVWLPVKVVLWILGFVVSLTVKSPINDVTVSQPTFVTVLVVAGVVLQIGALLAGLLLVRSGRAALARV